MKRFDYQTKKYYYPAGKPKRIKIGDRFKTLTENAYYSKQCFPKGSKVTFLGWRVWIQYKYEKPWRWPKFQFDGDDHKQRVIDFNELKKI